MLLIFVIDNRIEAACNCLTRYRKLLRVRMLRTVAVRAYNKIIGGCEFDSVGQIPRVLVLLNHTISRAVFKSLFFCPSVKRNRAIYELAEGMTFYLRPILSVLLLQDSNYVVLLRCRQAIVTGKAHGNIQARLFRIKAHLQCITVIIFVQIIVRVVLDHKAIDAVVLLILGRSLNHLYIVLGIFLNGNISVFFIEPYVRITIFICNKGHRITSIFPQLVGHRPAVLVHQDELRTGNARLHTFVAIDIEPDHIVSCCSCYVRGTGIDNTTLLNRYGLNLLFRGIQKNHSAVKVRGFPRGSYRDTGAIADLSRGLVWNGKCSRCPTIVIAHTVCYRNTGIIDGLILSKDIPEYEGIAIAKSAFIRIYIYRPCRPASFKVSQALSKRGLKTCWHRGRIVHYVIFKGFFPLIRHKNNNLAPIREHNRQFLICVKSLQGGQKVIPILRLLHLQKLRIGEFHSLHLAHIRSDFRHFRAGVNRSTSIGGDRIFQITIEIVILYIFGVILVDTL